MINIKSNNITVETVQHCNSLDITRTSTPRYSEPISMLIESPVSWPFVIITFHLMSIYMC
jgi:hypothetical protein